MHISVYVYIYIYISIYCIYIYISRSAQPREYLREVRNTLLKCQTQTLMSSKTSLCTYMKEKTAWNTCLCASDTFSLSSTPAPFMITSHSWHETDVNTLDGFPPPHTHVGNAVDPGWRNITACTPQAGQRSPLEASACNCCRQQFLAFRGFFLLFFFNHEALLRKCFLL